MKWPFSRDEDNPSDARKRHMMVEQQIRARGISDELVLDAMRRVPRHEFIPATFQDVAYTDGPLPIGNDQTISQPYMVAVMSEALQVEAGMKVLEIGTGSGYQTAVLAEMGLEVFTIEVIQKLADDAEELLSGYENIHFRCGDGRQGWPEAAPFDGIIVTAAPKSVPEVYVEQLAIGGHLVIPVGGFSQQLYVFEKATDGSLEGGSRFGVRFVPLV
ncbi:MAG: protein-L-isoaspartate(D-aspartate) O-methyltransferase [Puniceicoccaceae bacterium]